MVFSRLTAAVTRYPWVVIAIWLAAFGVLSSAGAKKATDVMTDDEAEFLPSSYESARALAFGEERFGKVEGATTTTVLVRARDPRADAGAVEELTRRYSTWKPDWERVEPPDGASGDPNAKERSAGVVGAVAGAVDPHGFQLVSMVFKGNAVDPWVQAAFKQLRADVRRDFGQAGYSTGFTGGVASASDAADDARPSEQLGQTLLFAAAILLCAVFFRGILAALVPLVTVFIVGGAASGLVTLGADALGLTVATSTPQLITVVLVGIGIDYFLFMLFRFREQLRAGKPRKEAARGAARRIAPVIASAALAVVVAFATLGLAQYGELKALGPAIALAVAMMLLAGVTLMPALLAVTGRALFWPSKSWRREPRDGVAARLGRLVARHPARVALASAGALTILAVGALGVRMNYDLRANADGTESARVEREITRALPRGATDPQVVYVRGSRTLEVGELKTMTDALAAVKGVEQVGEPVLTRDRRAAQIPLVLAYNSATSKAMDIAAGPLRDAAHKAAPPGTEALVGGNAGILADVSRSINRDLRLIFPLAALLILLILIVLLRSLVAPLYLLAAVGLEFAATLGASVWLFQDVLDQPGLVFTLPLILFLFVVALGTDYNMLASARLREEMRGGTSPRAAVATAVRHTAPAVGAAGAVLAVSFGTLLIEHDEGSKQIGFGLALGIILAAVVVSTLLVPSITALLGCRAWWPGNRRDEDPQAPAPAEEAELMPV
ncbi:MMPL family transporter [Solirubrobacter soli]|uniref:MMPL family transporter n=1 Tax=Solirubrobacter soli TaxID=363832 RepID=UPI00042825EA|nr:MMPL family transporter [Solirubrobacter soli]